MFEYGLRIDGGELNNYLSLNGLLTRRMKAKFRFVSVKTLHFM